MLEGARLWNEFWVKFWILKGRKVLRAIICYGPGPRIVTSPTSPQDGTRYTDPLRCIVCISLQLKSAWFQSRSLAVGTPNLTLQGTSLRSKTLRCCADMSVLHHCLGRQSLPPPTQYCSTEDGVERNGKSLSASALNTLAATLLR